LTLPGTRLHKRNLQRSPRFAEVSAMIVVLFIDDRRNAFFKEPSAARSMRYRDDISRLYS
jgi:hypothetical protein